MDTHIDILRLQYEATFIQNINNISIPIDTKFLCNICQVKLNMDSLKFVIKRDIADLGGVQLLLDNRSVLCDLFVEEDSRCAH